ncbi:MAG: hypothetical protein ACTSV2_06745 [Candidatus Thorarchaeota archaeon]
MRIEKTAISMKKKGHEMIFLGGRPIRGQHFDAFDNTHYVKLGNSLQLVFDPNIKKRLLKRIAELKPEVIHIHNPIIGHYLTTTDYPCIFNDHEYHSKQSSKFNSRPFLRRWAVKPMARMFPRWEKALISKYPTLTTHPNMTSAHQRIGNYVATVSNVPLREQVEHITESDSRSGIVYVGGDFRMPRFMPHRNLKGLKDIIDFDVLTGIPYNDMMQKLTHYKIGHTAWHPHPWHIYSDANKNYEYMHAGLPVITNNIIKDALFSDIPYVFGFNTYREIPEIIKTMPDFDPEEIRRYALKHYVWENFEDIIFEAYSKL